MRDKIINAGKIAIPLTSGKSQKRFVPWWNEEIAMIIKKKKRLFRKFRRTLRIEDYVSFIKIKSKARKIICRLKKECWEKFVMSINSNTDCSEMFKKIRQISGKFKSNKLNALNVDGTVITDQKQICDKMAQYFSSLSSTNRYSEEFQSFKTNHEQITLNIPRDCFESFNVNFSIEELNYALDFASGKSSPGPDMIHYQMLKNLTNSAKFNYLNFYNKLWQDNVFPEFWKNTFIIPIPKGNKKRDILSNNRGISLICCPCKILEKMVNKRLVWVLERNNYFSIFQAGFRKFRSTVDNLSFFESMVMECFADNSFLVAIFFDLEAAYDTAWRYLIIKELLSAGIKGNMLHFIKNFLENRTFQTVIGDNNNF